MTTNKEIARLLKETAALIEITGGNVFRARAFASASRAIGRLEKEVATLTANDSLEELPGIGPGLATQIGEILERGSFDLYEDLLSAIPPGLPGILRIKGLGAKKVRRLWQELDVTSVEELEEVAASGRLADLSGFGPKMQEAILENIRLLKQYEGRRRYDQALAEALHCLEAIQGIDEVLEAHLAGGLRRSLDTVDDIVIVAVAAVPEQACRALAGWWTTLEEDTGEERILLATLPDGFPLRIHVTTPGEYGATLWKATGSPAHVAAVRTRCDLPGDAPSEHALFEAAGMPFIDPAIREDMGEIEAAAQNGLPDLIKYEDIRGTLHNHSTWSDGMHALRQMTDAAYARGYAYYGVCDHSRSLVIANGLSIERVYEQQKEIRELNKTYGNDLRVFSGTECDILADGSLDYPDDVLATFDLVVAAIHTRFEMSEQEATERLIRAIENPYTMILAHPTGRLLLRRKGYPIHHEKVIDACAANGVALELNANPFRLDLDWRWIRHATDRGVPISINPDAHAINQLDYMKLGVSIARKGWLTPEQCLNAKSLDEFSSWLDRKRSRHSYETI